MSGGVEVVKELCSGGEGVENRKLEFIPGGRQGPEVKSLKLLVGHSEREISVLESNTNRYNVKLEQKAVDKPIGRRRSWRR